MTKPFHQLRITQLMGAGAETLIVPDTSTTTFLLCISILYVSVRAEANWVMKTLRLVSEYITSSSGQADLIPLTYLGILISFWKQLFVTHCWACLHYAATQVCKTKTTENKTKPKPKQNMKTKQTKPKIKEGEHSETSGMNPCQTKLRHWERAEQNTQSHDGSQVNEIYKWINIH